MHFLNELYEAFDDLVDVYDMYKLDIVGDCYIVVAGLIKEDQVRGEAGRTRGVMKCPLWHEQGSRGIRLLHSISTWIQN